jgi:hypothetical protein
MTKKNDFPFPWIELITLGFVAGLAITFATSVCTSRISTGYHDPMTGRWIAVDGPCVASVYPNHLTPQSFDKDGCLTVGGIVLWIVGLPFYVIREFIVVLVSLLWVALVGMYNVVMAIAAIKLGGCA